MADAPTSWEQHYDLIRILRDRATRHPEIIAYTIRLDIGPGAGLRAVRVNLEEDHKRPR